jgi:hypothetical protein
MTFFSYIGNDINRVKFDVKIGLIPCAILRHFQIYSRYDYYRKLENSVTVSVMLTSYDLSVSEITVYRVLKIMEREV